MPLRTFTTLLLGVLSLGASLRAAELPQLLWSDRGANTIRRANLDGSNVEILALGMRQIRGVAYDPRHQMLYWADNGTDKIQRQSMDDQIIEDLVTTNLSFPAGIDLDLAGGRIYWADADRHVIESSRLDGSDVRTLVAGLGAPYFIRLDLENQHIYWTDYGLRKIQRANFDGSYLTDILNSNQVDIQTPRGIDLDLAGGKLYWADRGNDSIFRANLDGSQPELLHTVDHPPNVDAAPHGVTLDLERGHVYWVDNGTVKLQRADLDGKNVVDILDSTSTALSRPWEIVLDFTRARSNGDFNGNGSFDGPDIDLLTQAIAAPAADLQFDLNGDQFVGWSDREYWLRVVKNSYYGDANLDGEFNSRDFTSVFIAGEYEDGIPANSGWDEGDWDGDQEFSSSDFVKAMLDGGYEQGPRAAIAMSVPEPSGLSILTAAICCYRFPRRRVTVVPRSRRQHRRL